MGGWEGDDGDLKMVWEGDDGDLKMVWEGDDGDLKMGWEGDDGDLKMGWEGDDGDLRWCESGGGCITKLEASPPPPHRPSSVEKDWEDIKRMPEYNTMTRDFNKLRPKYVLEMWGEGVVRGSAYCCWEGCSE